MTINLDNVNIIDLLVELYYEGQANVIPTLRAHEPLDIDEVVQALCRRSGLVYENNFTRWYLWFMSDPEVGTAHDRLTLRYLLGTKNREDYYFSRYGSKGESIRKQRLDQWRQAINNLSTTELLFEILYAGKTMVFQKTDFFQRHRIEYVIKVLFERTGQNHGIDFLAWFQWFIDQPQTEIAIERDLLLSLKKTKERDDQYFDQLINQDIDYQKVAEELISLDDMEHKPVLQLIVDLMRAELFEAAVGSKKGPVNIRHDIFEILRRKTGLILGDDFSAWCNWFLSDQSHASREEKDRLRIRKETWDSRKERLLKRYQS